VRRAEVLALVPARGGSKGLPRKNVLPLGEAPLLAWSVAAALQGCSVSRVVLSTDDPEIRDLGRAWGAEAPFLRPAKLARDATPDLPVFLHALEWLERHDGYRPDVVVQLRPTSPLRPPGLVDAGIAALLADADADSVRSVCVPGQNPYKMWRRADGRLTPLLHDAGPEAYNRPRQQLPPVYWQTGHLDVIRRATLTRQQSMTGTRVLPLEVDPCYAIDIDTRLQWEIVELQLERAAFPLVRPAQASLARLETTTA